MTELPGQPSDGESIVFEGETIMADGRRFMALVDLDEAPDGRAFSLMRRRMPAIIGPTRLTPSWSPRKLEANAASAAGLAHRRESARHARPATSHITPRKSHNSGILLQIRSCL